MYCLEEKNAPLILKNLIKKKINYFVVGGGTNIIASDKGFEGVIVKISFNKIQVLKSGILCDAGAPLMKLVNEANRSGFAGFETLAGIPGTVGGALFGNAGAYGKEVSEGLSKIKIFDGSRVRWIAKNKCAFAYRDSIFKKRPWVILQALFKLKRGDKKNLIKKSKEIICIRNKKYPPDLKCAGSIFKNIPVKSSMGQKLIKKMPPEKIIGGKIPVGFLLETVGAKGMRVGEIRVSEDHANLLINNGRGKADEVKTIINNLKLKIKRKYGVVLEEEVRYLE